MRKVYYICLVCLIAVWACLPLLATIQLDERVQHIIAHAESKHRARIGFMVQRLRDDSVLCQSRYADTFIPASAIKVLSTGAVLQTKGRHYRIPTEVYMTGNLLAGGILDGNLIIRGYGDPSLGSRYIPGEEYRFFEEITEKLKEKGITTITGGIYADASLPTGVGPVDSWLALDKNKVYGAGLYGLNFGDNVLDFTVSVNPKKKMLVAQTRQPNLSGVVFETQISKAKRKAISYSTNSTSEVIHVKAKGRTPFTQHYRIPHPTPAHSLVLALRGTLKDSGIRVQGETTASYSGYMPDGKLLHTYYSKTLDTLSKITNYRSQNLYAEAIAQQLNPTEDRGHSLSQYWYKRISIPKGELSLYDGSGLSRKNRITPRAFSLALKDLFGGRSPDDGVLVETLPEVGREGTVRRLMKSESHIKAYLKSGTMRGISTYVGYVYDGVDWYSLVYLSNGFSVASLARSTLLSLVQQVWSLGDNSLLLSEQTYN